MREIVKVTTVVVNGRRVYQLERAKSRRANRSFALNAKRPALTMDGLKRIADALRGAA